MWSISDKVTSLFYRMNDKVPIVQHSDSNETESSTSSNPRIIHFPRIADDHITTVSPNPHVAYEELLHGTVPCPSCDGSGRIPRDQEQQLVALIPFSDKRLKPRRTMLYVLIAVLVSVVVFGLCMFFLVPRSITLMSNGHEIVPYYASINETEALIKLDFINDVNITNNNYVAIGIVNATMNTIHILESRRMIGQAANLTQWTVQLRGWGVVAFNTSISFDTRLMIDYCRLVKVIYLQFDFMVTSRYLGHDEQSSLTVNQRMYCSSTKVGSVKFA